MPTERHLPTPPADGGRGERPGRAGIGRLAEAVALLPAIALVLCSVSSDMVATLGGDPIGIWRVLPAGPVAGDWVGAEVSSTAFLLVGIALLRRKWIGYWMALAMAAGGLVVQGAALDHPLSAATAVLIAAILLTTRRRYRAATGRREALLAAALLGGAVGLSVLAALGATGGNPVGTAAEAVGALLDLATPVGVPGIATLGVLVVAARIAYVLASVLALDPRHDHRSPSDAAAARTALRRLGSGPLYPYQLAAECSAWADDAGTAALAVSPVGRVEVALAGPAGDGAAARRLLDDWLARCRRDDLLPLVYAAPAGLADELSGRGWASVPLGREAVVDPASFSLSAPQVANARQMVARARRRGVRVVWSADGIRGLNDPGLVEGLARLDRAWRSGAGPLLGFTFGRFDVGQPGRAAIAVALDADGAPEAFVVLRATGSDGGWMVDVVRRARGAAPGAVELCLVTAIERLADAGVRRVSFGVAPLAGLDRHAAHRSERWAARAARIVRPVYSQEGVVAFVDKFAPTWEPRFLLLPSWTALTTALVALLRLHLGGAWHRVVRSLAAGLAPAR